MTVSFEAVQVGAWNQFPTPTKNFSLNPGSNANRTVIAWIWNTTSDTNSPTFVPTYGGLSPTGSTSHQVWGGPHDLMAAFWWENVSTGNLTLEINWTTSGYVGSISALAAAYSGAGAVSGAVYRNDGISGTSVDSGVITSSTGSLAVACFVLNTTSIRVSPTGGSVERYDDDPAATPGPPATSVSTSLYEQAGAATVTISATASGSCFENSWAMSIAAASAPTLAMMGQAIF